MNAQTRNAALRAAKKLSLGVFALGPLAGCGGMTDLGGEQQGREQEAIVDDAGGLAATCDSGPARPCVGEVPLPAEPWNTEPSVTLEEADCCVGYVTEIQATSPSPGNRSDPQLANCCAAILTAYNSFGSPNPEVNEWSTRDTCCSGELFGVTDDVMWGFSLCSPWGPPMPPSMDFMAGVA